MAYLLGWEPRGDTDFIPPVRTDTAPGQVPTYTDPTTGQELPGIPFNDANATTPVDTGAGHGILGWALGFVVAAALTRRA